MPSAGEDNGKSTINAPPRIPEPVGGIQVNFCKNPCCLNFGVPAQNIPQPRGRGRKGVARDTYTVIGTSRRNSVGVPALKCKRCGEVPTIKSNLAIAQELRRFWPAPPARRTSAACPHDTCENHAKPIATNRTSYVRHGSTSSGASRYRCKQCGKVFTEDHPAPAPHYRQGIHRHKNISVFKLLVGKMPLRQICEIESFEMPTLHQKIAFLYRQCRAFAVSRELELPAMKFDRLNIAVDRQDYVINWDDNIDKRNITLHCIASADNASSYVFGAHLDYDPDMDPRAVEADAIASGDYLRKAPFRTYARLWLQDDQLPLPDSVKAPPGSTGAIIDKVRKVYASAQARPDVEVPVEEDVIRRLPRKGMQVHSEYCIYGHFELLKRLLASCEKLVFYMDQESGIRAACHAAFWEQILAKKVDGFFVTIDKELTVNQKRRLKKLSDREMEDYVDKNPHLALLHPDDIRRFFLKDMLSSTVKAGKWSDRWLVYPFPSMSEPKKAVCWLTDLNDRAYGDDELAELYIKASLHGIDRFFMQIRRKVSLLERPIATSSSARRLWYAYAPYNPLVVAQLVEIFRVYYNFVKTGKDKGTPAMRLGLAKGKIRFEDIIYFTG